MCILKTEWYLDLYIAYIFLNEKNFADFFEYLCIYPELVVVVNHCFTSLFGTNGLLVTL